MFDLVSSFDVTSEPTDSSRILETALDRAPSDKQTEAESLTKPEFNRARWSQDELAQLMELGRNPEYSTTDLCRLIPNRSRDGIRRKMRGLMLRGRIDWSPAHIEKLLTLAKAGYSYEQIAAEFNTDDRRVDRSAEACRSKLRALGFNKPRQTPEWTSEQIALLRQHYNQMTIDNLAALLGRESAAIYVKAHRIGLTRKCSRPTRGIGADIEKRLRKMEANAFTRREVQKVLGVSLSTVQRWASTLGLVFKTDRSSFKPRLKEQTVAQAAARPENAVTGAAAPILAQVPAAPLPKPAPKAAPEKDTPPLVFMGREQFLYEPVAPTKRKEPSMSRTAEVDAMAQWLATNAAKKPSYSIIDQACLTMRQNGDIVTRLHKDYRLNGVAITGLALIERANRVRARSGKAPLLQAVEAASPVTAPVAQPVPQSPAEAAPASAPGLVPVRAAAAAVA